MRRNLGSFLLALLTSFGASDSVSADVHRLSDGSRPGFAPTATALSDGGYVVVWASPASGLEDGAILGRLLDEQGTPRGPAFRVSESPINGFGDPNLPPVALASFPDGGFFVAWRFEAAQRDGEIYGRRFSRAGSPTSGELRISAEDEFQINADARSDQRSPSTAVLEDGTLAVVWETASPTSVRLHGRLFDRGLDPLTADFPIDESASDNQTIPSVTVGPNGGFIVRWASDSVPDREREGRFDRRGSPLASAVTVTKAGRSRSCFREVDGPGSGSLLVWVEDCAGFGRIFARGLTTIFADGFEAGDTSAWSLRVPQAALEFVSPAPGVCLNSSFQSISLTFTDPSGNGLNPQTFLLSANGLGVPTSCSFGAGTISCDLEGTLPEGPVTLVATVEDAEGHPALPAQVSLDVDTTVPEAIATGLVTVVPDGSGAVSVGSSADAAEPGAAVRVTNQATLDSVTVTAQPDGSFLAGLPGSEGDTLELLQTDACGNPSSASLVTVPGGGEPLPPNPTDVAPPADPTVPNDFSESTEFIYAGPDPIQTGVQPGTIEETFVGVLRGRVVSRSGAPIAGVRVTCHGHPELGQTLTRADGMFDLAVNGGDQAVLVYEKAGFLPVQREIHVPRRDYAWAPDVVLIELDPVVTMVESGAAEMQVAQGSEVTDLDGTRQATVLVPAGTTAEMVLPDGTTQSLPTINLRVSEFTVGDEGPAAMPASLPPNVAYTWAAEISADEAIGAGATRVEFDQPVVLHLDNFLDMPVGAAVPLGYYDREKASWVGADNGLVIEILSIDGQGRAELDVDGSGVPADPVTLAALGITDDERIQLAALYAPGTSLWRMAIPHLTPWDANFPLGPSEDAVPPPADDIEDDEDGDDPDPEEPADPEDPSTPPDPEREEDNETEPDCDSGSVIECQNQVLGESVGIPGTGMRLHYASDRVPGRGGSRHVRLRLSEATVPSTLEEIELEIRVGGHRFVEIFPATPDLVYDLDWDGDDAYGRTLQGPQPVTVIKRYHYRFETYGSAADFVRSWERFSEGDFGIEVPRVRFPARYTWTRESRILPGQGSRRAGSWDARGVGLGGWSLSTHHVYDPKGRTLYLGTGQRRRVRRFDATLSLVAGGPTSGYSGDGGPATQAKLRAPAGLAVGADASLYIADSFNHVIAGSIPRESSRPSPAPVYRATMRKPILRSNAATVVRRRLRD